nr:hypothetical protein [Paracoccus sp. IB05]
MQIAISDMAEDMRLQPGTGLRGEILRHGPAFQQETGDPGDGHRNIVLYRGSAGGLGLAQAFAQMPYRAALCFIRGNRAVMAETGLKGLTDQRLKLRRAIRRG